MNDRSPDRVTLLGRTNFRNDGKLFGIQQADRLHHLYLIGRTGTGKSTLLYNMTRQDMLKSGCALLDPHGDLVEHVVRAVPVDRRGDLIYFDVPNPSCRLGFNPLGNVKTGNRTLASSGVLEVFKKLWPDFWGPRTEHILRNVLLALFEQPEPSLADALHLFDDPVYRKRAAKRVTNDQVRRFWLREFEGYGARLRAEAVAPVQNKIGAFLADPVLKRILTDSRDDLNLQNVMDGGRILLVNLSKGRLGEDSSSLLGSLLVSQLSLAALGRAELPAAERRDFFVYLDEFQTFTTRSLAGMLSELRKYNVGLCLAHQYLGQLDEVVRDAILGNVGSVVAFRVGLKDAETLGPLFHPDFSPTDLATLPNHHINCRLLLQGRQEKAFSGKTVPPPRSPS